MRPLARLYNDDFDIEIEVAPEESVNLKNEVTEKPVEDKTEIADHINHQPVEINHTFVIAGDEAEDQRDRLEEASQYDEVFNYMDVKDYRLYENMVILSINFNTDAQISNGYQGEISLKQVKVAEQETIFVNLGTNPSTGEKVQQNASETEERSNETENVDEDSTDQSIITSMISPFGGDE